MKIFYCLAILFVLVSCSNSNEKTTTVKKANPNINGAGLFNMHCASCHKCEGELTAPSLKGVESRWKDKELMYEFIRNPMGVIQKDKYAAELLKKYNAVMTPSDLTNEQIDAVLGYCNDSK
ncbi:MAG TPA: cytochrome c [Ferruginibacter sp.]|nr:cytochrome c [Ferruginibacter sp.]